MHPNISPLAFVFGLVAMVLYEPIAAFYGVICVSVTLAYTFYLYRIRSPPADLPYVVGMFMAAIAFGALSTEYFYNGAQIHNVTNALGFTLMLGIATWWMWCLRGDLRGNLHQFFLEKPRFSRAVTNENGDHELETMPDKQ